MTTSEQQYAYQRMRRMPEMIEATERKLLGLYREARRYGMADLLESRRLYHAVSRADRANANDDRASSSVGSDVAAAGERP